MHHFLDSSPLFLGKKKWGRWEKEKKKKKAKGKGRKKKEKEKEKKRSA
jgi:hypothetical protein